MSFLNSFAKRFMCKFCMVAILKKFKGLPDYSSNPLSVYMGSISCG